MSKLRKKGDKKFIPATRYLLTFVLKAAQKDV
jgi:hypothetical protein